MKNGEKVRKFFTDNLVYLIVILIGIAYILTSFFRIGTTGKTISEIVADAILTYLISTFILMLFRSQGIINGSKDERVIMAEEGLGEDVITINPFIEKLDGWCIKENENDLKAGRVKILANVGLKYSDCYDEDGVAKGFNQKMPKEKHLKKDYKIKIKGYETALRYKIKPLTTTDLTTCNAKSTDPHDFGRDKSQYKREENLKSIFSKALTVFVVAYFSISLFNLDWANVMWKAFQVCTYILMGVIQMFNSYFYMTDEYRNGLIKKRRYLQKFKNYLGVENGKENIQQDNKEN